METAPTIDEAAYHQAVAAEVHRAVEQDAVVVATHKDNPKTVLQKTMTAVACEAAALRWERERAQREGAPEAERISSRRVAALVRLADLLVVHEELRRASGEMSDEDVGRASDLFLADMEETVREVAPPEVAEKFLTRMKEKIAASALPCRTTP